jgi:hypothetical protein
MFLAPPLKKMAYYIIFLEYPATFYAFFFAKAANRTRLNGTNAFFFHHWIVWCKTTHIYLFTSQYQIGIVMVGMIISAKG